MKLLFRQRIFSWFDSYDIYDENGNTVFVVKGQLAWGHKLKICDARGNEVGLVREKILTFLPAFELYENGKYIGRIKKKLTLFSPGFDIDFNGWQVDGNLMEWDYTITDAHGEWVATVSQELLHLRTRTCWISATLETPCTCSCSPWPWTPRSAAGRNRNRETSYVMRHTSYAEGTNLLKANWVKIVGAVR